jgi:CRP-like cAMP-binding protein
MATTDLAGHTIFKFLRPEQMKAISEAAEEVTLAPGEYVYRRGAPADHFFVVLSGQVALRLPHGNRVSIQIDEVGEGAFFGSCICFQQPEYALTAQCTENSRILMVKSDVLKNLMDEDLVMGYTVQRLISRVYFLRYIETMRKLQAMVQSIPLEVTRH